MDELVRDFKQLFVGSELSHGVYHVSRGTGETVREPVTDDDYERHVRGEVSLGLVPVLAGDVCRFAAIDIDVDTINHAEVLKHVEARCLPLSVCRSKSGGAHLYVFMKEPGIAATQVRERLKLWAALLGYPNVEIFPKQSRVTRKNLGNWINLPYFAGDKTTRYALGPAGALTLAQFVKNIRFYDPHDEKINETVENLDELEMPPCLRALARSGLPEGMRNQGLFNFGVFFRKSNPKAWQDQLQQFNLVNVKPALSFREFQTIAKSLSQTRYQYMCEQSPIRELCQRHECLKLKYGVGNKPWEELDQYDDISFSNLRKVLTSPPRYLLEVNGHDLSLTFNEFTHFIHFRNKVIMELDLMPKPLKQASWDLQVKDLLKSKRDLEAPPDASPEGQLIDAFWDFLALRDRARDREDLLKGSPIEDDGRILFRINDFLRYIQSKRLDKMTTAEIFMVLKQLGCFHAHLSIHGRKFFAWSVPVEIVNEQTESFFTAPRTKTEEEL